MPVHDGEKYRTPGPSWPSPTDMSSICWPKIDPEPCTVPVHNRNVRFCATCPKRGTYEEAKRQDTSTDECKYTDPSIADAVVTVLRLTSLSIPDTLKLVPSLSPQELTYSKWEVETKFLYQSPRNVDTIEFRIYGAPTEWGLTRRVLERLGWKYGLAYYSTIDTQVYVDTRRLFRQDFFPKSRDSSAELIMKMINWRYHQ